jgi:hypothetical protein
MRLRLKIKTLNLLIGIISCLCLISLPVAAQALSTNNFDYFGNQAADTACSALNQLNSDQDCGGAGSSSVNNLAKTVVNVLSLVVGIVAVVMIIISGFNFITSGGDSQKVSTAKNSLIYAMIGIAIVALSQTLVHFVLDTSNSVLPCPTDHSIPNSSADCKPKKS